MPPAGTRLVLVRPGFGMFGFPQLPFSGRKGAVLNDALSLFLLPVRRLQNRAVSRIWVLQMIGQCPCDYANFREQVAAICDRGSLR